MLAEEVHSFETETSENIESKIKSQTKPKRKQQHFESS